MRYREFSVYLITLGNGHCSLTKQVESKKVYGFVIRFVQLTRMIERYFSVDSEAERDAWVKVPMYQCG